MSIIRSKPNLEKKYKKEILATGDAIANGDLNHDSKKLERYTEKLISFGYTDKDLTVLTCEALSS